MNKEKNKILVTGGAGYIGAHFINKLLNESEYEVIVIDNFFQGQENIINSQRVQYFNVDLTDYSKLDMVFKNNNISIVAHFAALASVPDSVIRPLEYYENNLVGGLNLLRAMREQGVDKIINSSSASVYGEPETEVIKEDHRKMPTNPYGYTKLIFEKILEDCFKAYKLNSISFRYFCAAGSDNNLLIGENHKPETHVIPTIINTILGRRSEFYVFGDDFKTKDGSGIRDYIHVNDLASAHIMAIEKLNKNLSICAFYNLGINKGYSVFDLIAAAEAVTGKRVNYSIKERRSGDPSKLIADSSLAQSELGWKPQYLDVENMIESTYNYFLKK